MTNKGILSKNLNTNTKYSFVYEGIVKKTNDSTYQGRLKVWIPELSAEESDESGWIVANYASPFAGSTSLYDNGNNLEDSDSTQSSYGLWAVPPDVGNIVLVFFANGRSDKCYWFSCVFQQYMNNSVPSISASKNNFKNKNLDLPVSEYNKKNKSPNLNKTIRPVHKEKYNVISSQGLIKDKIRGVSFSSARRESPSNVFGFSTPGPLHSKYKNKRLGGHSLYFDDNQNNEHMTLETRLGNKIKLDDTNGQIYIINRDGTAWIELDKDGNIFLFGAGKGNIRVLDDFNIRSDKNINFEAGNNISIKAGAENASGSIDIKSNNIDIKCDSEYNLHSNSTNILSDSDIKISSQNLDIKMNSYILSSVNYTIKSSNFNFDGSNLSVTGNAFASDFKTSLTSLNSHEHLYNPGPGSPTYTASKNGAPGAPYSGTDASEAKEATVKSAISKVDILKEFTNNDKIDRKTRIIETILETLSTYEPCPDHTIK
jgi:hypothetical protein